MPLRFAPPQPAPPKQPRPPTIGEEVLRSLAVGGAQLIPAAAGSLLSEGIGRSMQPGGGLWSAFSTDEQEQQYADQLAAQRAAVEAQGLKARSLAQLQGAQAGYWGGRLGEETRRQQGKDVAALARVQAQQAGATGRTELTEAGKDRRLQDTYRLKAEYAAFVRKLRQAGGRGAGRQAVVLANGEVLDTPEAIRAYKQKADLSMKILSEMQQVSGNEVVEKVPSDVLAQAREVNRLWLGSRLVPRSGVMAAAETMRGRYDVAASARAGAGDGLRSTLTVEGKQKADEAAAKLGLAEKQQAVRAEQQALREQVQRFKEAQARSGSDAASARLEQNERASLRATQARLLEATSKTYDAEAKEALQSLAKEAGEALAGTPGLPSRSPATAAPAAPDGGEITVELASGKTLRGTRAEAEEALLSPSVSPSDKARISAALRK